MAANFNIQLNEEQQKIIFAILLFVGGGGYVYFKYFWKRARIC